MNNPDISKIEMVVRQTNYDKETAEKKLIEFNNDPIQVIKDYLGITEKKVPIKSINHEIYKQLRYKLDNSIKEFNDKQYEKLEKDIENNNNDK